MPDRIFKGTQSIQTAAAVWAPTDAGGDPELTGH